ncbi:MAG TPA: hypothetical protein VFL83_22090 [Anaeromyxobacter sp.]|nr:hypothetical protein [Anaeromyxobacter sp.]
MHRTTSHTLLRGVAPALAAVVLATGCAGASKATKEDVVFPPPPQKGRIRWVQSFKTEDDFKPSAWRSFAKAVVPHDSSTSMFAPSSVALSPDEKTLYVGLPHRQRVAVVDLTSGAFRAIGLSAKNPLKRPIGVATDAQGNVYVTDKDVNAVYVFAPDGGLVRTFDPGVLRAPTGIAVDRRRQVAYVVSDGSLQEGRHTVEVFSLAGKHLRTIGGGRSGEPGFFNFPRSVYVSPSGELYVGDMLNFRVQVFDPDGQVVRTFGQAGSGFPGVFDKIHSVAQDTFGNIYVADAMQGIHILNPKAQPLMLFGTGVTGAPTGIAIDSRNRIYVADLLHAVHIFELINTTAADSYPGETAPKSPAPSGTPATTTAPTAVPAPATTPKP